VWRRRRGHDNSSPDSRPGELKRSKHFLFEMCIPEIFQMCFTKINYNPYKKNQQNQKAIDFLLLFFFSPKKCLKTVKYYINYWLEKGVHIRRADWNLYTSCIDGRRKYTWIWTSSTHALYVCLKENHLNSCIFSHQIDIFAILWQLHAILARQKQFLNNIECISGYLFKK
jgi:hypothetical protein